MADTPVVVVNGARQVGKSTLVTSLPYRGSVEIVTLDDVVARAAARVDPRSFVERPVDTLVIDEAQLEPALFRAVKAAVDRDRRPGRFVLTGSSRLLAAPDMADALVGRVEIVELWPLAQSEIEGARSDPLDCLFTAPQQLIRPGDVTRADLIDRLCAGGFPDSFSRSPRRRRPWFDSYVTTTIERVVSEIADIERASELPRLLRLCAARSGQELNVASIASDFGAPVRTVNSYIARLATAFLIHLIPAWSTNLSAKVVRRPKLVMVDTGLAAHLMGMTERTLITPGSPALGALLENFVATEVLRLATWSQSGISVHHFRDRDGAEVDLVVEAPDGRIVGIEVKATSSVRADDFRGLRFLAERLGDRFAYGVVLSTTPEATPFGPKMAALPVDVLWRA